MNQVRLYTFILDGFWFMCRQNTRGTAGLHDSSTGWTIGRMPPLWEETSAPLTTELANPTITPPTAINKEKKQKHFTKPTSSMPNSLRWPPEKYAESDECFMKRDIAPPICFRSSNFLFSPLKRSQRQSHRGNTISENNGGVSTDQMSPQPVVAPALVSAPTCV